MEVIDYRIKIKRNFTRKKDKLGYELITNYYIVEVSDKLTKKSVQIKNKKELLKAIRDFVMLG